MEEEEEKEKEEEKAIVRSAPDGSDNKQLGNLIQPGWAPGRLKEEEKKTIRSLALKQIVQSF